MGRACNPNLMETHAQESKNLTSRTPSSSSVISVLVATPFHTLDRANAPEARDIHEIR